jgi:predicted esterase YcpF (UPF0227 family)
MVRVVIMISIAKTTAYIYLHGFASSPRSSKARYLRDRFKAINLNLAVLDLNLFTRRS